MANNNRRLEALERLVVARQHVKSAMVELLAPTPDNHAGGRELGLAVVEIYEAMARLERLEQWRELQKLLNERDAPA